MLLLDAKDQEVLIDGAMTPVMRLKLIQSCDYWDVEEECNDPIEERAVYTQNIPSPLREKLTKKKKESFIKGIQRLHVATRYLLRNHQLPTVDRLLDLLAVSKVEGVDWCMHTEQEYDDDGNVVSEETGKHEKAWDKKDWDVYLESGGRVEYFLDDLLWDVEFGDDGWTQMVKDTNDGYFRDLDHGEDMRDNEQCYYSLDHARKVREELKTPHPLGCDWKFLRYKMLGPCDSFYDFRSRQHDGKKFDSSDDANAYTAYVKAVKSGGSVNSSTGDKKAKRKVNSRESSLK